MSTGLHFIRAIEMGGTIRNGLRFQRMLMRRMTQSLLAQVGDERPAVFECAVELAVAALFPLQLLQLRFTIGDWTMAPVVEATALKQSLWIEPFALRERDGLVTYGLLGLHDSKPLIAVTAAQTVETVFVRIGGFDRSIFVYDDELDSKCGARQVANQITQANEIKK
jgi:hypothetical protein